MTKNLAALAVPLCVLTAAPAEAREVTIKRSGTQASRAAPGEYFTGAVRVDPLFENTDPSNTSGSSVTFEAGARSVWHTHPLGQTLIVTAGTGRVQRWGDPVQEIRPGDVVSIPPGQKHWHGASPHSAMTHIAIQGAVAGRNVEWLEKVTDAQYRMAADVNTDASEDLRAVSPALDRYTQTTLAEVWKRPGLSSRDRSLVTVAVFIARNQAAELPSHLALALDNGVKPSEISEAITHLAFYSGWGAATSAAPIARNLFRSRGLGTEHVPAASGPLLPMDPVSETRRAAFVERSVGAVAPGIAQYTSEPLFHDLWLRPALAPRDRSLITLSALIASGQVAQLGAHLNRALDNGLTQAEASEMLTHLLFYAGWPNVFSAVPVARDVFEKRPGQG